MGLVDAVNAGDDVVYNGANDDASGTTAVIALAKYFKELKIKTYEIKFKHEKIIESRWYAAA